MAVDAGLVIADAGTVIPDAGLVDVDSGPPVVVPPVTPPVITLAPQSVVVAEGSSVTLFVTATGSGLGYRWQTAAPGSLAFTDIAGAASANYTTPTLLESDSGRQYRALVYNSETIVISEPAIVLVTAVHVAPTITQHPQSATVLEGVQHIFTAAADDWEQVVWQYRDGSTWFSIAASEGSTSYSTNPVGFSWHDGRQYRARFTNGDGDDAAVSHTYAATVTVQAAPIAEPPPPPAPPEEVEPNRLHATFDSAPTTGFGDASSMRLILQDELGPRRNSYREGELSIVSDGSNRYLRQRYVPSSSGSPVVGYQTSFAGADEMWVSYRIYFEPGFEWVKGGKLPGLFGGSLPSGGSTSRDGFSARMMWRSSSRLAFYAYHYVEDRPGYEPSRTTVYGEDFPFTDASDPEGLYRAPVGRWITVRQHIKLNSGPYNYDGVLEGWIDGVKRVSRHPNEGDGLRWFGPDSDAFDIEGLYYSSFYGGGDPSWSPSSTTYIRFDDFRVATTREGVE